MDALELAAAKFSRTILDLFRASTPPEDALPGDPCGLLLPAGPDGRSTICDGVLDPHEEVWGGPGPLSCATCLDRVTETAS